VRRVYYGWYVVAMAAVIYTVLTGATSGAFGIFVLPVSAELKLTRAEMNTALIFQHLGNAALAPLIGRLLDRVRAKPIMIACAVVFALSFVSLGLSRSLWLSALIMAVGVPTAYLGAGSLTNAVLIARWFSAHRGRAMLLAGLGLSIGTMIAPPIVGLLVEARGWRMALVIMGAAIGALLLTFGLAVRERPGPSDVEAPASAGPPSEQDQPATSPMSVPVLLRIPDFWLIGLSTAIAVSVSQSVLVTLVPLGRDTGLSMLQAASLVSVLGGGAVAGGLAFSLIADKVDKVILVSALFLLEALVNGGLLLDKRYAMLLACAGALGIIAGTVVHAVYALLADRFGTASFGTVRGMTFLLFGALGMIFIRFAGEVFDRTGSYDLMFGAFVLAQLVAAALMFANRFSRRGVTASGGPELTPTQS
jgi:MFS family permease